MWCSKSCAVAFELKEDDLMEIMDKAGFKVSKPEMSALFRNPDHKKLPPLRRPIPA